MASKARATRSSKLSTNSTVAQTTRHAKGRKASRQESDSEQSAKEYDSDALDDDSDQEQRPKKRKRKDPAKKTTRSPRKRARTKSDDEKDGFELQEGQEAFEVVKAPTTGQGKPRSPSSAHGSPWHSEYF